MELGVSGATAPIQYSLLQGAGHLEASDPQKPAVYEAPNEPTLAILEARDSTGATAQAVVSVSPPITVEMKPDPATGYQFTVLGGAPPISYEIQSRNQTSTTLGAPVQTSVIVIRDAEGTSREVKLAIDRQVPLAAFAQASKITTLQRTRVLAVGGTAPYQFTKESGPGTVDPQTGEVTPDESSGDLAIAIQDANGNRAQARVQIVLVENPKKIEAKKQEELRSLTLGQGHSCSMLGGEVQCWGDNHYGQLGTAAQLQELSPKIVSSLEKSVVQLSAGYFHTCALQNSGTVVCWGDNRYGQSGLEVNDDSRVIRSPHSISGIPDPVRQIALGQYHSCATTQEGEIYCWGSNRRGQLGTGDIQASAVPRKVLVPRDLHFIQVAAGAAHSCGLTDQGQVFCWGFNGSGQLGEGSLADRVIPHRVSSDLAFDRVAAGGFHTCGISKTKLYCWGNSAFGQAGNGVRPTQQLPIQVASLSDPVNEVALGFYHSCVRIERSGSANKNEVRCWGSNQQGQLGMGSLDQKIASPQAPVGLVLEPRAIASGIDHTCVLGPVSIQCWGSNELGQLGSRTLENARAPNRPVALIQTAQEQQP